MPKKLSESVRQLIFTPIAARDLHEIWRYLAERAPDYADGLLDELYGVCELIAANPLVGRLRSDLIINLRQLPHKNYNIFYFPTDEGVEIYRILHGSRNAVQIFEDSIEGLN